MITEELKAEIAAKVNKDSRVKVFEKVTEWNGYFLQDDTLKLETILEVIKDGWSDNLDFDESDAFDQISIEENNFQATMEIQVDGEVIWTNAPSAEEIIEMIKNRMSYLEFTLSICEEKLNKDKEKIEPKNNEEAEAKQ